MCLFYISLFLLKVSLLRLFEFWLCVRLLVYGKGTLHYRGPGSSVSIATDYGLDSPRSNPSGERDFPLVQTGPRPHPGLSRG